VNSKWRVKRSLSSELSLKNKKFKKKKIILLSSIEKEISQSNSKSILIESSDNHCMKLLMNQFNFNKCLKKEDYILLKLRKNSLLGKRNFLIQETEKNQTKQIGDNKLISDYFKRKSISKSKR
jgi:CRISPR/Cas system-associated protein Cas5 (RAMP superfamily)